jgi:hypothetical protein
MTEDIAAGVPLVFAGALTMRTVDDIHATLREAIERPDSAADPPADPAADPLGARISIDCAAATEVDLTFVQLLIASRISAPRVGKTVQLAAPADGALLDTLTRGGFQAVRESCPDGTPDFWFEGTRS